MATTIEGKLLTKIRVLEVSEGPSISYAGRLFALSGASVTKVFFTTPNPTDFLDHKKEIVHMVEDKEDKLWGSLLSKPWDIILWDNCCHKAIDKLLTDLTSRVGRSMVGVRVQFPLRRKNLEEESYLQSIGAWMDLTGDPGQSPLRIGGYPASYLIGAHAATASLFSLLERVRQNKGRLVEVNVMNILASALEGSYGRYLNNEQIRTRVGNRHRSISPMAILPALDHKSILVGAPVDEKWELLSRWAEINTNPKWKKKSERYIDVVIIEKLLAEWTKNLESDELFFTGQAFRMPFGKVQTIKEVRNCPQLKNREFFKTKGKKVTQVNLPWKLTKSGKVSHPLKNARKGTATWAKLRILDLTSMWSGPYCTRLFADIGAEVIKIEAPNRPDGIRANKGSSAPFFQELNRNKYGITLDLKKEEDRKTFLNLVITSDVIVENYSPRVMENFGLTKEVLWKCNPELIIMSLSAFGQEGPYKNFIGYGPTLESMSGIVSLTHYSDRKPWLPGFSISDIHTGIHGAFVLLGALLLKEDIKTGLRIDVSQYEVACQLVGDYLIEKGQNSTIKNNKRNYSQPRTLNSLIMHQDLTNMLLKDGSKTIDVPWKSEGWNFLNNPAPQLGEHNQLTHEWKKN